MVYGEDHVCYGKWLLASRPAARVPKPNLHMQQNIQPRIAEQITAFFKLLRDSPQDAL
ncbi:hypothetical protein [Paenibacillus sp. NPDC093718]|uniref:hypothetical protein n=1 Tax=Paenibacillus sp. NPDC093718 TaxID=3390601 RepID=UPI003CFE4BB9